MEIGDLSSAEHSVECESHVARSKPENIKKVKEARAALHPFVHSHPIENFPSIKVKKH
jgi:hypothetical protein